GEEAWPSQPIPQLPKPFSRIAITEEDINPYSSEYDSLLTVYLQANKDLYTPLSEKPTFILPGSHGGAEWGGAAVDENGILYINSNEMAVIFSLRKEYSKLKKEIDDTGLAIYKSTCETCHRPDLRGIPQSGYPSLIGLEDRLDRGEV